MRLRCLIEDGKQLGFGRSKSDSGGLDPKSRVDVVVHLFGCFEILLVSIVVIVLAVFRAVLGANFWSSRIDSAAIIVLQIFANGMDQQIPHPFFDKDRGVLVDQVPANHVKISSRFRHFDGNGKVPTAFRAAVIAKALARFQIVAMRPDFGNLIHVRVNQAELIELS